MIKTLNTNTMKTKVTSLLALFLFAIVFTGTAQMASDPSECQITLSLYSEAAKAKNYNEALKHYDKLVKECPKESLAIYQYGDRMFKHFIEQGDASKVEDLIQNYKYRLQFFPEKSKEGDILGDIAQAMYDNDLGTKQEQFDAFDKAQKTDPDNFTSPKGLYTYFNLAIQLQDAGQKDLQDIFELYDVLIDMAVILKPLMEKQENEEELSKKEAKRLNAAETNLGSYGKIKGSINTLLGQRADCDNLIPLFESQYESKKNDVNWLKVSAGKLNGKECETPLFFKMVQQLHNLEPSAKSAYYLGRLADKDGNSSKALEYYNQAADLETNPSDKARVYYSIAENFRKKGSFGSARNYYNKMLEAKPSAGIAYLRIASMYASSANNCGTTPFEKRAIYWKAADMASKAARVDASLASNANSTASAYRGRAPGKQEIFSSGMAGKTISFSCWVGGSVRVPNL